MSQKYVKPPLSPPFIEDRLPTATTSKSSASSSIQPIQKSFPSTFDSYLNRHSVAFLISGTTHSKQSTDSNLQSPILDKERIMQKDFSGESPSAVTSHEVQPTNMRDVAQILSTLKDNVAVSPLTSQFMELCLCQNRENGILNKYWRTVLDCMFCEKRAKEALGEKEQEKRSIAHVSRPARSLGPVGRISKVHRCSDCGGTFKQRGALVSHVRGVHRGFRPYVCDLEDCSAAYKYRGDLNRHKAAIHRGIKPFPCALCGIPFARKSVRDRHARKKHG